MKNYSNPFVKDLPSRRSRSASNSRQGVVAVALCQRRSYLIRPDAPAPIEVLRMRPRADQRSSLEFLMLLLLLLMSRYSNMILGSQLPCTDSVQMVEERAVRSHFSFLQ